MKTLPSIDKKDEPIILDIHKQQDIEKIADEIVFNGGVVAFPVVFSYGLITVSTNVEGMVKIFKMKDRPLTDTLVIGGSAKTRKDIVDWDRMPDSMRELGDQIFDLPHFLEMPIKEDTNKLIGKNYPGVGRTGVIFWANFYEPLAKLEEAVKRRNKKAFLVGSSANIHGQTAAETATQAYDAFKNVEPKLKYVVQDKQMEKAFAPFHGAHTMIQFRDGKYQIVRVGSISAGHFSRIYPQIDLVAGNHQEENERWQKDQENGFHIDVVRKKGSYII
jgi:tRNA A37 threonylcarbamoyladenosine synthetase subunit TsaC/SUA5/YrdC